jgi:hypothetical protein
VNYLFIYIYISESCVLQSVILDIVLYFGFFNGHFFLNRMLPSQDVKEGNILIQWGLLMMIRRDPVSEMLCFEHIEGTGQC